MSEFFDAGYCLRALTPFLPTSLVSPLAQEHLVQISKYLPLISGLVLECRLGDDASDVDYIAQVVGKQHNSEMLAGTDVTHILPVAPHCGLAWQSMRHFCQVWDDRTSDIYHDVTDIWFEFDVDGRPLYEPVPSFFFSMARYDHSPRRTQVRHDLTNQRVSLQGLTILLGQHLSPLTVQVLVRIFAALPAGSRVFSVGVMYSRDTVPIRICISGIESDNLLPFLAEIGWPGAPETISPLIATIATCTDALCLALDVTDAISAKVGIECYLLERNPRREQRWTILLDQLVKQGHCAPVKSDSLLAWFGGITRVDGDQQGFRLGCLADEMTTYSKSVFVRTISHLKIVYDPYAPLQAKAYLSITQGRLTRRHSQ